jgi:hypothetical protein
VAAPPSPQQRRTNRTKTGTAHRPSAELHPVIELDLVRDAEEDDVLSSDPSNKVINFGDDLLAENSNRRSLWSNDKQDATAPNYTYDDLDGFHHDDDDNDSDEDWYSSALFDDDDDDDDSVAASRYCVPSARGKGAGRRASVGRPPKPNTEGMSAEAAAETIAAWKADWKKV